MEENEREENESEENEEKISRKYQFVEILGFQNGQKV